MTERRFCLIFFLAETTFYRHERARNKIGFVDEAVTSAQESGRTDRRALTLTLKWVVVSQKNRRLTFSRVERFDELMLTSISPQGWSTFIFLRDILDAFLEPFWFP